MHIPSAPDGTLHFAAPLRPVPDGYVRPRAEMDRSGDCIFGVSAGYPADQRQSRKPVEAHFTISEEHFTVGETA
jgi:hypothetical protein